MDSNTATVRFTSRPDETVRASRLLHRNLYRWISVTPAILFVAGLPVLLLLGWPDSAYYVVPIWVAALILLALNLAIPAISVWQVSRRYPEFFNEETLVSIDEGGLHAVKGAASTDRGWSGISDFIDDREFIFIRQGRRPVAVIPKRAFAGTADQQRFLAVLRVHVESKI